MNEQDFKKAIENNEGCELIANCNEKLTKKQRELAFNNAIERNWEFLLIENCHEKLTQEEIAFIKNTQQ